MNVTVGLSEMKEAGFGVGRRSSSTRAGEGAEWVEVVEIDGCGSAASETAV